MDLSIPVSARRCALVLGFVALALVAASLGATLLTFQTIDDPFLREVSESVTRLASVDEEGNIPAWYSASLLLLCSLLLAIIATAERQRRSRYAVGWLILSLATANRKSFTDVRPWVGLQPVLRYCIDKGLGSVLGSFLDAKLLAAAFVVHVGKAAAWVYGGYVDGAEKYSPTQVLQFEAIRESLEKGMDDYNFGNLIAEGQPAGRGVDEFKLGFGAVAQRHLDTIVWKRKPVLYAAIARLRRGRIGGRLEALFKRKLIRRGELGSLE